MEIEKAMKQILETIGINENGVDLVDRVLSLKTIDKNVSSVELFKSAVSWTKISAQVRLEENFSDMEKFREYVDEKGLNGNLTIQTGKNIHYSIYSNGVEVEFY